MIRGESGLSLIEALIGSAIVIASGAAIGSIIVFQMQGLEQVGIADSRSNVTAQLSNAVGDSIGLLNTAANSLNAASELAACVTGSAGGCQSLDPMGALIEHPITLLDSAGLGGTVVAGPLDPLDITHGLKYNTSGLVCGPTEPIANCPYVVVASFVADCNGAASCPQARRIRLNYRIHQNASAGRTDRLQHADASGSAEFSIPLSPGASSRPFYVPLGKKFTAMTASSLFQPPPVAGKTTIAMGGPPDPTASLTLYPGALGAHVMDNFTTEAPTVVENDLSNFGTFWNYWGHTTGGSLITNAMFVGYWPFYPTANGPLLVHGNYIARDHVIAHSTVFTGGIAYYTSDETLKKNIEPIPNVVAKVDQLIGVSFNWKDSGTPDLGFTAQNVETVFPELVGQDDRGFKTVQYGNLVSVVLEAFRLNHEQEWKQIEEQNRQLVQLENEIQSLEHLGRRESSSARSTNRALKESADKVAKDAELRYEK